MRCARASCVLLSVGALSGCIETVSHDPQSPPQPGDGRATTDKKTRHATGRTEVKTYVPSVFDEVADGPSLVEVQVTETFKGDIEGDGMARVIQEARKNGSASLVGIERVRGSIARRKGTFLLQVSGTLAGEAVKCGWFVVPGSGTGDLKNLRGEGGFKAQLGQHGSVWLDYYFE